MECDQRICYISIVLIIICASCASTKTHIEYQPDNVTKTLNDTINDKKRGQIISPTFHNCNGLQILDDEYQPIYTDSSSFLRKCCEHNENLEIGAVDYCQDQLFPFNNTNLIINATFYDNCIEDKETNVHLNWKIGLNKCINGSNLIYGADNGDTLYVLQNGSLLTFNETNDNYDVFNEYCLDMDRTSGKLIAIVCLANELSGVPQSVLRAEAYLYLTCLLISVPCLLTTAFLYLRIDDFSDLHGKSLACHSICLAIAYLMLCIAQIPLNVSFTITYFIQYFIMACLCWMNALCVDICIKIWYSLTHRCNCSTSIEAKLFVIYTILSYSLPMLPVCLSMTYKTIGIPTYYIKGHHNFDPEHVKDSLFMVPAFILLLLSFICVLIALFMFLTGKLNKTIINEHGTIEPIINENDYYMLKQTTINVTLLFSVMSTCMLTEMLASYLNSLAPVEFPDISPFAFIDIFIALQGVFIFIIFVLLPKPSRVIRHWWVDAGSFLMEREMEPLKQDNNGYTQ